MLNEFPIVVEVEKLTQVRQPGGIYEQSWEPFDETISQLAPITDDKRLEAMQELNNLIYEWFIPFYFYQKMIDEETDDVAEYFRVINGDDTLELRGRGKDLGGKGEIVELTLRLVTP